MPSSRKAYTGFTSDIVGANDVYSSAVHEIGHALGMVRWPFFNNETADGDIDVTSGPFADMTLPVRASHFDFSGPVLSRFGRPLGQRRKITQLDLAAVCQVSQFGACDYSFRPGDPEGDYNGDGTVDAADYTVWVREARSTNILPGDTTPGLVRLNDWHVWRANYGATADWITAGAGTVATGVAQVPEPGGFVLVLIAVAIKGCRCSGCPYARRTVRA